MTGTLEAEVMTEAEVATTAAPATPLEPKHYGLRNSVESALKAYFSQLDGQDPANLYSLVLEEMEVPLLRAVLKYTRGNQCKAAILLGISRGTLRKKIQKYRLD